MNLKTVFAKANNHGSKAATSRVPLHLWRRHPGDQGLAERTWPWLGQQKWKPPQPGGATPVVVGAAQGLRLGPTKVATVRIRLSRAGPVEGGKKGVRCTCEGAPPLPDIAPPSRPDPGSVVPAEEAEQVGWERRRSLTALSAHTGPAQS